MPRPPDRQGAGSECVTDIALPTLPIRVEAFPGPAKSCRAHQPTPATDTIEAAIQPTLGSRDSVNNRIFHTI